MTEWLHEDAVERAEQAALLLHLDAELSKCQAELEEANLTIAAQDRAAREWESTAMQLSTVCAQYEKVLQTIARWELPAVSRYGKPSSFEYEYGSNGAREYMRNLAHTVLEDWDAMTVLSRGNP